ncbi:MAG: exodeoxyribonuclease VII small subunit [Planctomycetaceae bacterium]
MAESDVDGTPESFEAALQRLAELVAGLESGSLGLSASIAAYEHGVGILKRLHEELANAEERVKVLVRIDDEGRPVLEDSAPPAGGDDMAAGSPQTASARPARTNRAKAARPRQLPGMDDAEPG